MKVKFVGICVIASALMMPVLSYAADTDTDRSSPKAFVKDSVITTKVKAKLAKDNLASTTHIKVDTDNNGVVWLSGTAKTKADVAKAISIANETEGVTSVKSHIKVKAHS